NGLEGYVSGGYSYVHVNRDAVNKTQADYWSAYAGDTFTKDRLTLNLGVRFDRQKAKGLPSSVTASRSFPDLLGAIDYDGNGGDPIVWTDLSPRAGLTYALDESRKTVLRASYARYASQLASGQMGFVSPIQSPGAYFAYVWS